MKVLKFACALSVLAGVAAGADDQVRLRLFAPAWREIGNQRPQEVARKFTIIFGHLPPAPFHEGNPEARCIKYTLGPYVTKALLKVLPAEAFVHDRDGNVPKAREFANWLVVPDNPSWIEYQKELVRKVMNSDFDGLLVDSMGTAPVDSGYLLSEAINPNTGSRYTRGEWIAAETKMFEATVAATPPGKLIFMNGLGPGTRYWTEPEPDSPRPLLRYVQGAMSESIWRQAKAPLDAWPTPEKWMLDVRMVQDVERRGLIGFWWTKCWSDGNTSWNEPNAKVLVPQWLRFALASYLLAAGPHSYFNFDTMRNDKPKSNAAEYFPEYDIPLGRATGEMRQAAKGVYWRPFSNGIVVVNPAAGAAGNLRLSGRPGTVSIAPHTGLILVNP